MSGDSGGREEVVKGGEGERKERRSDMMEGLGLGNTFY